MTNTKLVALLLACIAFGTPAWAGHTLTSQEQKVLENWLAQHPKYRVATDRDCECDDDIKQTRAGYGGEWHSVPDYHPYVATGDFGSDGQEDFAVVVIDRSKQKANYVLVVFNGPFASGSVQPAFVKSGLELRYEGLFFGPPRPKPYRLLVGEFESDTGFLLVPHDHTYAVR